MSRWLQFGLMAGALLIVAFGLILWGPFGGQSGQPNPGKTSEPAAVDSYPVHQIILRDIDLRKQSMLDVSTNQVGAYLQTLSEPQADMWARLAASGDLAWDNAQGGNLIITSTQSALVASVDAKTLPALSGIALQDRRFVDFDQYDGGALQLIACNDGEQAVLAVVRTVNRSIELIYARRSDGPKRFDTLAAPAVRAAWRQARARVEALPKTGEALPVLTVSLDALHLPSANMLLAIDRTTAPAPSRPSARRYGNDTDAFLKALDRYYDDLHDRCDAAYDSQYLGSLMTPRRAGYVGKGPMTKYAGQDLRPILKPTGSLSSADLEPGSVVVFQSRLERYILAQVLERSVDTLTLAWALQPDGTAIFPALDVDAQVLAVVQSSGASLMSSHDSQDDQPIIVAGLAADAPDAEKLQALARSRGGLTDQQKDQMKRLLARGTNREHVVASAGTTALQGAAMVGNVDGLKLLLESGAKLEVTNAAGWSALHFASVCGEPDAVRVLLEKGADPARRTGDGQTALELAVHARRKSPAIVDLLRKAAKDQLDLFTAVELQDINKVQSLLASGASPNQKNMRGLTPLHIAANRGYARIADVLLDRNADAALKSSGRKGQTALTLAAGLGHGEVVKVLLENRPDKPAVTQQDLNDALYAAVTTQKPQVIADLLAAGADAHYTPKGYPFSAVQAALVYGSVQMVQPFAEAGIDLPIWANTRLGELVEVKQKLDAKADPNAADPMGRTALYHAVAQNHIKIASLLLERGADANRPMTEQPKDYPLHIAAEQGNASMVELLIKHDAKVNAQAGNGRTPLYMAVMKNHLDAARVLLEAAADPNLTPALLPVHDQPRSESLLELAKDHPAMFKLLRNYRAR